MLLITLLSYILFIRLLTALFDNQKLLVMYFAHNSTLERFELFISFLSESAANNGHYQSYMTTIIKDAHDLSSSSIDYSKIASNNLDLVAHLALKHPTYFKELDVDNLSKADFDTIKEMLIEDLKSM